MTNAPERIYDWSNTQMSIARHSGGLTYMGHTYYVYQKEEGAPLVKADVLERERKEKQAEKMAVKQFQKLKNKQAQGELL